MRHLFTFRIATLGLMVACAGVGCRREADVEPLVVLVSGDTEGWIVPCGCASNQSGGLPRRDTCIERLRAKSKIVVADVGGAAGGSSEYDRLRLEAIARGEILSGIDAHNIGASEAALGPNYLRELARRLELPLVSANTSDSDGKPIAPPLRIIQRAGRRVALIGVLAECHASQSIRVGPPGRAVLDALDQLAGQYDAAVVLAYLPEEELRELAETLPEVDAIIGGPTGQPILPVAVGPTLLASATNKGKFLVRLDAPAAGTTERWSGSIVELSDQFDDHPRQLANLNGFREELTRADFSPERTSFVQSLGANLAGRRIAGTESCRECHTRDCEVWDASAHARAWKSLQDTGAHVDPECQRCHTTGYGLPGGFVSVARSRNRTGVGCESCHGRSQAHVDDPERRTTRFARADTSCIACHDHENSPEFEYDPYWAKVRHGRSSDESSNVPSRDTTSEAKR